MTFAKSVLAMFAFAVTLHLPVSVYGQPSKVVQSADWPTYGGDPGGQRYSTATQIDKTNVTSLKPAWTFHTGIMNLQPENLRYGAFEATPILFRGLLYFDSPTNDVFAIDPATGTQHWNFRSGLNTAGIARGVSSWSSPTRAKGACSYRIFVGTRDARLIALDADTGTPCADFGTNGTVDLLKGLHLEHGGAYHVTSPPTVIDNLVVVGSGIDDNVRVDASSGVVRAFDCITGKLVWAWEPIPWAQLQKLRTGAANAWSVIAADPEHHLLFVPTGSASPDFYGGSRPGDNRDANSVVALDAATGRRVWGFQVVHHDVWDYDIAAEPLLFTFHGNIPAIAINTKQGMVFVLNRLTGEPLYPVQERPVHPSDVPGEELSATQPFSSLPSLAPLLIPKDAKLGGSAEDERDCRDMLSQLRYDGIYTPPTLGGTLNFPGNLGGVNWGGAAFDPNTGILYANTNRHAFAVRLIPRDPSKLPLGTRIRYAFIRVKHTPKHYKWYNRIVILAVGLVLLCIAAIARRKLFPGWMAVVSVAALCLIAAYLVRHRPIPPDPFSDTAPPGEHFGRESGPQIGTPYSMLRQALIAPASQHPCTPQPWGAVSALDLNTGKIAWQTTLGTTQNGTDTGTLNLGGDTVTASGLLFTAASQEPLLRAFDSATGKEMWQGSLPAPAQATPMIYTYQGRQYVVIAAGGHAMFRTPLSDTLIAFALPTK